MQQLIEFTKGTVKECPCCGSKLSFVIRIAEDHGNRYHVCCGECGANGSGGITSWMAKYNWNHERGWR